MKCKRCKEIMFIDSIEKIDKKVGCQHFVDWTDYDIGIPQTIYHIYKWKGPINFVCQICMKQYEFTSNEEKIRAGDSHDLEQFSWCPFCGVYCAHKLGQEKPNLFVLE